MPDPYDQLIIVSWRSSPAHHPSRALCYCFVEDPDLTKARIEILKGGRSEDSSSNSCAVLCFDQKIKLSYQCLSAWVCELSCIGKCAILSVRGSLQWSYPRIYSFWANRIICGCQRTRNAAAKSPATTQPETAAVLRRLWGSEATVLVYSERRPVTAPREVVV